jgi:hypothetical protein
MAIGLASIDRGIMLARACPARSASDSAGPFFGEQIFELVNDGHDAAFRGKLER